MVSALIQKVHCIVHVKRATTGMDSIVLISMNVIKNQGHALQMGIALIRTARLHVTVKMDTLVMDKNALTFISAILEYIPALGMHRVPTQKDHITAHVTRISMGMDLNVMTVTMSVTFVQEIPHATI